MKALLKKHGITEKQVELIRLVAKHPIFGARELSVLRVVAAAVRHGVIKKVWLDQKPPILRTVTDNRPGSPLTTTSNEWYELEPRVVAFMADLDPSWAYIRPSAKWAL